MGANFAQAFAGLVICIGLILVLASLARKHQGRLEKIFSANLFTKIAERRLKVVERAMLAPGHTAIILQKDGIEHFVIISPQSSQIISPAAAPQEVTPQ